MKPKSVKFWMIWSPQGRTPTYQHHTREEADLEAHRLAMNNPGQEFFVLKSVGGKSAAMPAVKDIKFVRDFDETIPF